MAPRSFLEDINRAVTTEAGNDHQRESQSSPSATAVAVEYLVKVSSEAVASGRKINQQFVSTSDRPVNTLNAKIRSARNRSLSTHG